MSEKRRTLMIVEDDRALQMQLKWAFDNCNIVTAFDFDTAMAQFRRYEPPVVIMDLGLPPDPSGTKEGFRLIQSLLGDAQKTKIIVLTGQQQRSNAVEAISLGAYDFFEKPFDTRILHLTIDRAFRLHDLQEENLRLAEKSGDGALAGIITRDPQMLRVCRTIEKVASTRATVMLLGQSGTGKEVLARALHDLSPRRSQRFVAINCAAIPETLLESELFGYERGAFTGATKLTLGKIETAHKGTLFLDEIGDLPGPLQGKLLRFLQERVIERLGGREVIPIDVRVVCATHQQLDPTNNANVFREDLYYRLAEIVVDIPALSAREGDATLLAHAFVRRFCREQGRRRISLSRDAVEAIEGYSWPGNVRELENCIRRAVIMSETSSITAMDIGIRGADVEGEALNLRLVREDAERQVILRAMGRVNSNIAKAAEMLGISRPTLYDMIRRYGITQ